jgi:hypothetical protein
MICVPSGIALPAIDVYDREHAKTTNDFGSGHSFTHAHRLTASGRQARSAPYGVSYSTFFKYFQSKREAQLAAGDAASHQKRRRCRYPATPGESP